MKIGDAIVFIDPLKREYPALVTAVWAGPEEKNPCLNLVYVSEDESKTDTYGRQIERRTSFVHVSNNGAGANCYKHIGE